jgi:nitric oxide reductase large subunit
MVYWRWWVVHLWVEGFFEVFATAVCGLLRSAHPIRCQQEPRV